MSHTFVVHSIVFTSFSIHMRCRQEQKQQSQKSYQGGILLQIGKFPCQTCEEEGSLS